MHPIEVLIYVAALVVIVLWALAVPKWRRQDDGKDAIERRRRAHLTEHQRQVEDYWGNHPGWTVF